MRYVVNRLIQLLIVIFAVTFLTSVALRFLPGGSDVVVALKTGPGATTEQAQAVKSELGLDKPIVMQYVDWMKKFVTGDWGFTFQTNQSIKTEVVRALPISAYIMVYAQLLSLLFALPVAMWSAYRQGSKFDRIGTTTAFGLLSAPNYIVAPVLMALFSVQRNGSRSHRSMQASTIPLPTSRRSCFPS